VPSTPLVIAHRGASGYRPEHTRSAYELGIAQGADAVEPDIVPTKDGVLVVRHENEISGTTDVASHPEFADRRTRKIIEGKPIGGWFTEDFTWAELSTLRARERLPKLRPASAAFDGTEPILRLADVRELVDATSAVKIVAELKHASYFASIGLPLDELFAAEMRDWSAGGRLVMESFEQSVLLRVRERGVLGDLVFLAESHGHPADTKRSYAAHLTHAGLARLADEVDGVSPDVALVVGSDLVSRAHDAGLSVFTWTLRAEEKFVPRAFRGDFTAYVEAVFDTGVDGVFADQPDLVLGVRSALK
jgi:glycerophosphoryl diester phosphodiesterase